MNDANRHDPEIAELLAKRRRALNRDGFIDDHDGINDDGDKYQEMTVKAGGDSTTTIQVNLTKMYQAAPSTTADFLMLDETIPHDPQAHEAEFTMHYDSTLHETLRAIGNGEEPARAIFEALETVRWQGFPESSVHLRYVENHDESRYLGECGEAALRAAAATIFTLPGAPLLYYGQERGMTADRGPMKWHDGDTALTEFHRSLSRLRDEYPVLNDGRVDPISVGVVTTTDPMTTEPTPDADGDASGDDADSDTARDDTGDSDTTTDNPDDSDTTTADSDSDNLQITDEPQHVVAFARDNGDQRLLVVVNFGEIPATVSLPTAVGDTDLRTGEPLRKRHDPRKKKDGNYVVVDDVVVCRPVTT